MYTYFTHSKYFKCCNSVVIFCCWCWCVCVCVCVLFQRWEMPLSYSLCRYYMLLLSMILQALCDFDMYLWQASPKCKRLLWLLFPFRMFLLSKCLHNLTTNQNVSVERFQLPCKVCLSLARSLALSLSLCGFFLSTLSFILFHFLHCSLRSVCITSDKLSK